MDGFNIRDPRFVHYIQGNAPLEEPATSFRWLQGLHEFDVARLTGGDVFHKVEPGYADGLCVDEDGNLWSSAADVVHCIDPNGKLLGKVFVPYRVSNLCFGGLLRNRLFIGGSHTLYAILLNRRGVLWP